MGELTTPEAGWLLALVREVFRPAGPRLARVEALRRGELPDGEEGERG